MTNDKQRERLVELLEKHCAVAECKAHSQDCTAEDCASCLADHILADGWMRPPCKVGDKIYIVADVSKKIIECTIIGAWICGDNCTVISDCGIICNCSFGKTVFLSREEAEAKLKEGVQG